MPRILIAECKQEVSTFNPVQSHYEDFRVGGGPEILDYHRGVREEVGGALSVFAGEDDVELLPSYAASSNTSGGVLDADSYSRLRRDFTTAVSGVGPVDAAYFSLHGAMQAAGFPGSLADTSITSDTGYADLGCLQHQDAGGATTNVIQSRRRIHVRSERTRRTVAVALPIGSAGDSSPVVIPLPRRTRQICAAARRRVRVPLPIGGAGETTALVISPYRKVRHVYAGYRRHLPVGIPATVTNLNQTVIVRAHRKVR